MRKSLMDPIPEFGVAAKILDAAADAVTQEDMERARHLIALADYPEIMCHTIKLVGKLSFEVHRQVRRPDTVIRSERDKQRMPSGRIERSIFDRDGWRCRFCGIKVISRKARSVLLRLFPNETHWSAKEFERHASLYSMAVSLDHVLPHSRGGKNEESNFVTVCYGCQFGRGEWTLDESELFDPRDSEPVVDAWDGLVRLEEYPCASYGE